METQNHELRFERVGNDEYRITSPDYDWEDFKSFLTAFRQVAMSEQEPVYLPTVRNVVSRHAGDELRAALKEMKADIIPRLEGRYLGVQFGRVTPSGDRQLTSYQILDTLVNGIIFHSGKHVERHAQLMDDARFLLDNPLGYYLMFVLSEIVVPVLRACIWLCHQIRAEGLLSEQDFPPGFFEETSNLDQREAG